MSVLSYNDFVQPDRPAGDLRESRHYRNFDVEGAEKYLAGIKDLPDCIPTNARAWQKVVGQLDRFANLLQDVFEDKDVHINPHLRNVMEYVLAGDEYKQSIFEINKDVMSILGRRVNGLDVAKILHHFGFPSTISIMMEQIVEHITDKKSSSNTIIFRSKTDFEHEFRMHRFATLSGITGDANINILNARGGTSPIGGTVKIPNFMLGETWPANLSSIEVQVKGKIAPVTFNTSSVPTKGKIKCEILHLYKNNITQHDVYEMVLGLQRCFDVQYDYPGVVMVHTKGDGRADNVTSEKIQRDNEQYMKELADELSRETNWQIYIREGYYMPTANYKSHLNDSKWFKKVNP